MMLINLNVTLCRTTGRTELGGVGLVPHANTMDILGYSSVGGGGVCVCVENIIQLQPMLRVGGDAEIRRQTR